MARHSRRKFLLDGTRTVFTSAAAASTLGVLAGCRKTGHDNVRTPDLVWGRKARTRDAVGMFHKPRAMVIDSQDYVYIVDMMGKVQVFDADGNFQRSWLIPLIAQGKPTGIGLAKDNSIMVADTHYFRVLFYSRDGQLDPLRTIGGVFGDNPGEFHFVTDVCQNQRGHIFVAQYGQIDQIQEFDPDGVFVRRWGKQGRNEGDFARPQALAIDRHQLLWIVDAHNHRVQVFRTDGPNPEKVMQWGAPGNRPGELRYPYGIDFDADGSVLLAELGNHRVQRLSQEGKHLEMWGGPGAKPGEFSSPWSLAINSKRQLFVLDSLNNRVQRFALA